MEYEIVLVNTVGDDIMLQILGGNAISVIAVTSVH